MPARAFAASVTHHNCGAVAGFSAIALMHGSAERLQWWSPRIPGQIGAHLQLTSGTPILPRERVRSLVCNDGTFPTRRKEIRGPRVEEVLAEWEAQIEFLLSVGIEPTHLDSHHHVHGLPDVFPAFCELAKRHSLPVRSVTQEMTDALCVAGVPCIGRTLTGWYGGDLSAGSLLQLLQDGVEKAPQATRFEVMCHPGVVDESLPALSRYVSERETELEVLCDPTFQQELGAAGFLLSPLAFPRVSDQLARTR